MASCTYEGVEPVRDKNEKRADQSGKLFGEGLSSTNLLSNDSDSANGGGVSVNSFLWRASLDTLSFVPLSQVDPFGGVIITDWYSPPETPNERFKLNVYILTRQLRSDGIRVSVFKQQQVAVGVWRNITVNEKTAAQLENSILTRARQMRISFDQGQVE
ncbi:DUF3576 domain-containing protein [Aestuariispira insulae]|nr:DUF3576 domain-containing protein [Aestuariispira insulae]